MKTFTLPNITVLASIACAALAINTVQAETISAGIQSTINASTPGSAVAGTIDSAYVTAVFGSNAYVEDATGGIYAYNSAKSGFLLNGVAVGSTVTSLGNGSFAYFATGGATQFEYATANTSTNFTGTVTSGSYTNIPASYYTTQTVSQFTSSTDQGSVSSEGLQNQLLTLNNVVIAPTGTASATMFTSGGTYTITDATGSGTLYVNAASGIVGTAIPAGPTTVSGVFQDYKGTSELLPRGTYDIGTAPEPSSWALLGAGIATTGLAVRRKTRAA